VLIIKNNQFLFDRKLVVFLISDSLPENSEWMVGTLSSGD